MNADVAIATLGKMPYVAAGIGLMLFVSTVLLKVYSSRRPKREDGDKGEPSII